MAATANDFVLYAPRNHFYYVPTGARWVKKGVEAAIGKHGIAAVIEKHVVTDEKELVRLFGMNGCPPA